MTEQDSIKHWYAFKIFFSKGEPVKEYFASKGMEYFYEVKKAEKTRDGRKIMVEEPVIPSLIFLYATQKEAEKTETKFFNKIMLYKHFGANQRRVPSPISDREMTVFKIVAESGVEGLDFYDEFVDKFTKGDKVRVIDGVFKGAEGHIVRIKKNHRLCVCITGLCAVATGYIPKVFLEKI